MLRVGAWCRTVHSVPATLLDLTDTWTPHTQSCLKHYMTLGMFCENKSFYTYFFLIFSKYFPLASIQTCMHLNQFSKPFLNRCRHHVFSQLESWQCISRQRKLYPLELIFYFIIHNRENFWQAFVSTPLTLILLWFRSTRSWHQVTSQIKKLAIKISALLNSFTFGRRWFVLKFPNRRLAVRSWIVLINLRLITFNNVVNTPRRACFKCLPYHGNIPCRSVSKYR